MKYKKYKNKKYTAVIPNTLKATKKLSNNAVKQSIIFFNSMKNTVKSTVKRLDKKTAKRIRNITRKLKKI